MQRDVTNSTSFVPGSTRRSPDCSDVVVMPAVNVATYLDAVLKVLKFVSLLADHSTVGAV